MKTYVINLERSPERKEYMANTLKNFPSLNFEFISAVDGRAMSQSEQEASFNNKAFKKRYSFEVRPGEIGCTLSHQKCYRKIVEENEPYVLILEDDIVLPSNITSTLKAIEERINTKTPQIILLSGWYWFYKTSFLTDKFKLAHIYDAYLTHSYIINQAAAKILIEKKPHITADDWRYIRKKGIQLQAVFPHLISQDQDSFSTTIQTSKRIKPLSWKIKNFFYLLILKILYKMGYFEKA